MSRIHTIALVTLVTTLGFMTQVALGNPDAEQGPATFKGAAGSKQVLLVKRDKKGVETFYKVTKKVTDEELTKLIEDFEADGTAQGISKIDADDKKIKVGSKNPATNLEAEAIPAKQSWYFGRYGYRGSFYAPVGYWRPYYYGYGSCYPYYGGCNYWASSYAWGCGYGTSYYGVYYVY